MENINYDNVLQQLPSNKIYEEFNSEVTEIDNNLSCDKFDSIKEEYKLSCVNICKKVARNLNNLTKTDKLWSYDVRCSHYKYWVYEEIGKLFIENSPEADIKDVITKFLNLQSSLTEDYRVLNCTYNFDKKTLQELNDKKDEKYLYDYFTNYENIKSKDFCISFENDKYKNYLNVISKLYNVKKSKCCGKNLLKCPNYFLNCGDEFDPSNLLSKLESSSDGKCNGLESFLENKASEEILVSNILEPDFLDSIFYTDCNIKNNSNLQCSFIRASSLAHRNKNAFEYNEQRSGERSSEEKKYSSKENLEHAALHEEVRKIVGISSETSSNLAIPKKEKEVDLRWNISKDGTLRCTSEILEKDTSGPCTYMEELVKKGIFIKLENSLGYRLKKGKTWPPEVLKIVIKKKNQSQMEKYKSQELGYLRHASGAKSELLRIFNVENPNGETVPRKDVEYYLLQNTFFTPFGSNIDKIKKRKKRYRTNFADLNAQRFTRKFIKRTYRNSNRRRFSVVNIEQ
ncbi:hypothetical protein MKS88_002601 [Plasmodium brasilianum]|uniref:Uncharacterized protein n=1 Tax=Plasmodium brasilianum TaxID=5824 RepID=A0ACB9YBU3_PLABR|nr:hypothetical protein MKS88_002601 [Plasmodium brasilianum]